MDSLRGFDEDAAWSSAAADDEPAIERPPSIGVDERRMHVRAYNYWVSLLNGRDFPSIADLKPERIGDFGPHSVLLDFTRDPADPDIAFLGATLRAECALPPDARRISQVPRNSLLSRLTDHYLQIIANRAPIGFEAEFDSDSGRQTLYRGILMPLSTDCDGIDFIYGVINWKQLADGSAAVALAGEVDRAIAAAPAAAHLPVWADGPHAELPEAGVDDGEFGGDADGLTLSLWPEKSDSDEDAALAALPGDAGLYDRLDLARSAADLARQADQRSRAALYRALGHAYDFALAAEALPDDYAELLADAGVKRQARAPMTPVAKLIFGAGYDKTRLTEFAAALSWARRSGIAAGAFADTITAFDGGLKGMVAAERAARRPEPKPRPAPRADRLRDAEPLAYLAGPHMGGDSPVGEFVLLLARSEGDGRVAIVAPAVRDPRLVAGALAKAASS